MSEALVLGLVATVLSGVAGHTVQATLLVYTESPQIVQVNGKQIELSTGATSIPIQFPVENGVHEQLVRVETETLSYALPVTVIGKRSLPSWLWGLTVIPAAFGILFTARVRRRDADNS
jgi:hypothetical protein